ncbi:MULTISPECIES: SCO6745 family protein [unclassified Geodermatophilus]|uniref:SCO6745 family protein n=1 Tax=unclassified Geodermatophilus TaxID=2637632 RepID=UPI003EE99F88
MTSPATARRLWALGEPFHGLTYFADECRTAAEAAGLDGFWSTYFAMRAAPLGPVSADVVTAIFYNFAPAFVARRVPAVWEAVTPAAALSARLAGVDAAVRRVLGYDWPAAETAQLAAVAAAAVDVPGRPLAAANAGLPVPGEPHLALWQALTTLREHRGDGHNAALLQRGISGVGAHVLAAAAGRTEREWLMRARGWDDAAWEAAADELTGRGWLAGEELTADGAAIVAAVEADTDRLALGPWRELGDVRCDRLAELLGPVRRAVLAAGLWPDRNPIGVPDPA